MRTIWQVFTRDLTRILRNPVAVVVTLGVAIIPSLYAWFNILANWDPYSATGNLQVAVVNDDKGTDSPLAGRMDAGKQVVAQLEKNHQLGWRFVSRAQAMEGMQSGEYYAAIVMDDDFSSSLANAVTGSGERPKITYYVNEKKNAIAPKITDTGASTIDEQINQTFVATVGKVVAKAVTKAGDDIEDKANATTDEILADLDTTNARIRKASDTLAGTRASLDKSRDTVAGARRTLAALDDQLDAARRVSTRTGTLLDAAMNGSRGFTGTLTGALDAGSAGLSGVAVHANAAAGTITGSLDQAQDSVDRMTSTISRPLDDTAAAIADVKAALTRAGIDEHTSDPLGARIWSQIDDLDATVTKQQQQVDRFHSNATTFIDVGKSATQHLSDAAGEATNGGIAGIGDARQSLTTTIMPNLDASLNGFAALNGTLNGTIVSLKSTVAQADGLFGQLDGTLAEASTTIGGTRDSLKSLESDVTTVRDDVATLQSSGVYQRIRDRLKIDDKEFGEFMGSPVTLATKTVYPIANYGSAVTPFYTNLALWVGGFVLIAIYKLEVDREGLRRLNATHAYLGRWMLLVTIGFLQAVIACIGDLVLGIQCAHPVLFVLAGVFCSFVYINIIYALAVAFRHIGKAVAVILVIMQIPGASGLYPIEMMPNFFRELHPWLPFTYGINAMRGPIGGMYANHYWLDMLHLAYYLPVALFVGLVVRRYAMNLNALFDRRLGDTDLMITEHNSMVNERASLTSVFRAASDSDELREIITRRAHRFFTRYPKFIVSGLALLTVLPLVFLVLLFVTRAKIAMLTAWIVSIIVIDVYLIVVEYTRESYSRQLGTGAMTAEQLRDVMLNGYIWRRGRHEHERRRGHGAHGHDGDGKGGTR
ncbi:YhgE/Pip domain-containing protein [Bifidobacterium sp. MA2]|uniref:YhgE/Pip domain-containing protein n=1 Tax=Bifidobacterium santillanense TaxID=2809028 RepID=A0ABS5UQJ4_9BIFI|nr:YhgE/Pip domain-containing protein [Bifidobacterium santillanense]MBT1173108.1 YhgE/Pip domain-containing protein [Bifidobacterium santillanense]